MKHNEFYYSNIHGYTIGAQVKEGDFIESVTIGDVTFTDGWVVINHSGVLGIVWGFKQDFTPFEDFASRVIFTLREEN